MVHSNTELLIDYWRGRRGSRPAPARADIDLAGFVELAPRVFIVERRPGGDLRFRLAGEAVAELHGGPLGGASLLALWRADHRQHLAAALDATLQASRPLIVEATASALDGSPARVELVFAPLIGPSGQADRFLGHCQLLGERATPPLKPLVIASLAGAPRNAPPPGPRLAAVDGQRIAWTSASA